MLLPTPVAASQGSVRGSGPQGRVALAREQSRVELGGDRLLRDLVVLGRNRALLLAQHAAPAVSAAIASYAMANSIEPALAAWCLVDDPSRERINSIGTLVV